MQGVAEATQREVVAIDGKVLRRALDKASGSGFLTMVSAWSTANGVVLGQLGTDAGSNEVATIPRLLELLHLKGCLVTIDAAGCQTEVAAKIADAGGDYLLAVRDNQPKLHAAVREQFDLALAKPAALGEIQNELEFIGVSRIDEVLRAALEEPGKIHLDLSTPDAAKPVDVAPAS